MCLYVASPYLYSSVKVLCFKKISFKMRLMQRYEVFLFLHLYNVMTICNYFREELAFLPAYMQVRPL